MNSNSVETVVKTNRQLELNLGTFNIPTIVAIMGVIGMIWQQSAQRTAIDTKFDARLSAIEENQERQRQETTLRQQAVDSILSQVPQLTYRVQGLEQDLSLAQGRIDRQDDNMDAIRSSQSSIETKLEVLTQRIEMLLPPKKAELDLGKGISHD